MDKSKFSNELPDELYPKLNTEQIAGFRGWAPAGAYPRERSFSIRGRSA
jgi:hypothetical protein